MNKTPAEVRKKDTAAIILAGGKAKRLADKRPLGGKAECIIGGKSLLSIVSGGLVPVNRSILVVGGYSLDLSSQEFVPVLHFPDHQPN
ncbi:MAG: nucleotidyltransferase family protein, partial [Pirellulales bacterium]|nr:nucleotidyltransferase family protein [Pirellulales bacterium]